MSIWKMFAWKTSDDAWNRIDETPIPIGIGRIWLADKDGNVTRAMSWTWRILKRREPGKYRRWMTRVHGAKQPSP
ncbi:MAG: hypothetical protein ACJ8FZ_20345, partial [Bradyrhizobium sp.]